MQPDAVRVQETVAWLRSAHLDLRAARVDMDASPPLSEDALFHCQQAVEKALKGYLSWHDEPFRKTHSLVELGVQCAEINPDLEAVLREAAALSVYATKYRYPQAASVVPSPDEAASALELATRTGSVISADLPEHACGS